MTTALRSALGAAALVAALGLAEAALAQGQEQRVGTDARTALSLTVYNQDLAQVTERRRVALQAGQNRLALEGVSQALRPETVVLGGDGLRLVEQVFAFDLITPHRLLESAVGEDVLVIETNPETGDESVREARLLGVAEGPVLRMDGRIETEVPGRIALPALPEGLRERPTLVAVVASETAGEAELAISYLTSGLSWQADYVAELEPDGARLDLTGTVTLTNSSGTAYPEAELRLVAGEVRDVREEPPPPEPYRRAMGSDTMMMAAPEAVPSQPAAERHLYTLERAVSLGERETKQVVLFRAAEVAAERQYRFENLVSVEPGPEEIGPVSAAFVLEVENTAVAGLGRPLPAGTVRVYEAGARGGRLFAGADRIDHTATGGTLELTLGNAFDVTGIARRTAFERLSERSYETAQEIVLGNAGERPAPARVIGHMPPGWRILSESHPHERETANRLVWEVPVPAGGEATLTYRARVNR